MILIVFLQPLIQGTNTLRRDKSKKFKISVSRYVCCEIRLEQFQLTVILNNSFLTEPYRYNNFQMSKFICSTVYAALSKHTKKD